MTHSLIERAALLLREDARKSVLSAVDAVARMRDDQTVMILRGRLEHEIEVAAFADQLLAAPPFDRSAKP